MGLKAILFLVCLSLASCAGFTGDEQKGTYSAVFFGTDIKAYAQSAGKVEVGEANQSQTALSAIRTAGMYGTASLLAGVQENADNNATREVIGGQRAASQADRSRAATEQLRIRETTKLKTLTHE